MLSHVSMVESALILLRSFSVCVLKDTAKQCPQGYSGATCEIGMVWGGVSVWVVTLSHISMVESALISFGSS